MARRAIGILTLLLLLHAGSTDAAILFSDNFNTENGGTSRLNFSGFTNWTVAAGTVDLVYNGGYSLYGDGGFIDLDGSTGTAGTLVSKNTVTLGPGSYRLSYDLSGSQRNSTPDAVVVSILGSGVSSRTVTLASSDPFSTFYDDFTLTTTADIGIQFVGSGVVTAGDNCGLLLDNVVLESTNSIVPEPAGFLIWSAIALLALAVGKRTRRRTAA